jgi:hypothetical protein
MNLINHTSGWNVIAIVDSFDLRKPWRQTAQMAEDIPSKIIIAMAE